MQEKYWNLENYDKLQPFDISRFKWLEERLSDRTRCLLAVFLARYITNKHIAAGQTNDKFPQLTSFDHLEDIIDGGAVDVKQLPLNQLPQANNFYGKPYAVFHPTINAMFMTFIYSKKEMPSFLHQMATQDLPTTLASAEASGESTLPIKISDWSLNQYVFNSLEFMAMFETDPEKQKVLMNEANQIVSLFVERPDWDYVWHTTNTKDLATTIYNNRSWGLCPILGDALMDVGCTDDHVLNLLHNQTQFFGRGVWIIDQLIGK